MMKKKHQITYLAAEAKAREEELQNQWAQNRNARRQTQNKYGF
jgi:proline-rich protein PRCC